jgi:hypothetical protein
MFAVRLWITTSHCRWAIRSLPSTLHALYSPYTCTQDLYTPAGINSWSVDGMKVSVFWYAVPCSLVHTYRRFRGAYYLYLQVNDRGTYRLWNVGQFLPDQTVQQPGRQVILRFECYWWEKHTHTHKHKHEHSDAIFLWNMERGQKCNIIYTCSITVTCSLEGHNITSASQVISLLWFQTFMQCLRFKFIKEDDRWGWS